jgi:hypothetical protein
MARFPKLEVLNEIMLIWVSPVFHHPDFEEAKKVILPLAEGGARLVEFTIAATMSTAFFLAWKCIS